MLLLINNMYLELFLLDYLSTCIVSDHGLSDVGVGPNHCNSAVTPRGEWKRTTRVFEKHNSLMGRFKG